jgi:hypothetical protein
VLSRAHPPAADVVRDLQHDLKALGYHGGELTGLWGAFLDKALAALRWDLTHPHDTPAIAAFNESNAVVAAPAAGVSALEPGLAQMIATLAEEPAFHKAPASADAAADNARAWAAVRAMKTGVAPAPYLAAIFRQESGGRQYAVPSANNSDSFIVLGLDHNDAAAPERITSRGYGIGQHTLFHHPPSAAELAGVIGDPVQNARGAFNDLRQKFDQEVVAPENSGAGADDRRAEHPLLPLRLCKYPPSDPLYMADCKACAMAARKVNIAPGQPVYPGAVIAWAPTCYYAGAVYHGVPDRADFLCDWPYAVRRYNGSGLDSYHYQAHVLGDLLLGG